MKKSIHNLIILDESGSMEAIKKPILQSFNEVLQTIRANSIQNPDVLQEVTFTSFNGLGIKTLLHQVPIAAVAELDDQRYVPNATTPLYDAIGLTVEQMKKGLHLLASEEHYVLVSIFTDGLENASENYSGSDIHEMVQELSKQNWTFTYIGTNHDVSAQASSIGIFNSMQCVDKPSAIRAAFVEEQLSRSNYYNSIARNEKPRANYFKK